MGNAPYTLILKRYRIVFGIWASFKIQTTHRHTGIYAQTHTTYVQDEKKVRMNKCQYRKCIITT